MTTLAQMFAKRAVYCQETAAWHAMRARAFSLQIDEGVLWPARDYTLVEQENAAEWYARARRAMGVDDD